MEADTKATPPKYLACERRRVYALLMFSAGMMGAYTFILRGGVFCNAQTANVLMMAIAFGQGEWKHGLYYFIPMFAYVVGAFLSELLPKPVRKIGLLRWDTCFIGLEMITLFAVGFVPLSAPHQAVQITINFISSMQYNTFRQSRGIPMATTFCTNHVRMVGVSAAKFVLKKNPEVIGRAGVHGAMLACFVAGGAVLAFAAAPLQERSIWLALIPLGLNFIRLAYADLYQEHDQLNRKPAGH